MSREKQIGTAWAQKIAEYLAATGFPYAERRVQYGVNDKGDLTGIPDVVIEAKREQRTDLSGWLREAHAERENAGARIAAVWAWRRGKGSPADAYVLMDGATFVQLLREAGYGEPLP